MMKKFDSKLEYLQKHDAIIKYQLERGIFEKVKDNGERKHYMPHHSAMTPDKSIIKIRVNYVASAKAKGGGKSLNNVYIEVL